MAKKKPLASPVQRVLIGAQVEACVADVEGASLTNRQTKFVALMDLSDESFDALKLNLRHLVEHGCFPPQGAC